MELLEKAILIATEAHAGQLDKAGAPYILHPLRVMLTVSGTTARIVAALHDIVEDTRWTLTALAEEGFPEPVISAVDALTRREGENYDEFIRRAAANSIARIIKRADLMDNMDLSRIKIPTNEDIARMERYQRALTILDNTEVGFKNI